MPRIVIETKIYAPIEICFDLSRSIDLHVLSTSQTNEIAIEGKTSGLINLNESVTWQATHFRIRQKLSSIITEFQSPIYFKDEQLKGAFKYFKHEHFFSQHQNYTLMKDVFEYESPLGIFGKIANFFLINNHLKQLLIKRNQVIKEYAENGKFKEILKNA